MPNVYSKQALMEEVDRRDTITEHKFERIAIVDRGEAAMRVIRAGRELNRGQHMGLSTVAIFTEPDRHALFVRGRRCSWHWPGNFSRPAVQKQLP